jgi:hypothetical protein
VSRHEKPSPGAARYFANLMAEAEAERIAGLSDQELAGEDPPSAEALLAAVKAKAAVRATSRETPASKVVPIGHRRRRTLWWVLAAAAIVAIVLAVFIDDRPKGAHAPPQNPSGRGP